MDFALSALIGLCVVFAMLAAFREETLRAVELRDQIAVWLIPIVLVMGIVESQFGFRALGWLGWCLIGVIVGLNAINFVSENLLDLRVWREAINGSPPVKGKTLLWTALGATGCLVLLAMCTSKSNPVASSFGGEIDYATITGHSYQDGNYTDQETVEQRSRGGAKLGPALEQQQVSIKKGNVESSEFEKMFGTMGPLFADEGTCQKATEARTQHDYNVLLATGKVWLSVRHYEHPGGFDETGDHLMPVSMPSSGIQNVEAGVLKIHQDGRCTYVYVLDGKYAGSYAWLPFESIRAYQNSANIQWKR